MGFRASGLQGFRGFLGAFLGLSWELQGLRALKLPGSRASGGPGASPNACSLRLQLRVSGLGFRVSGLGFRVSGLGFRVSGFGFRVSGLGFRV